MNVHKNAQKGEQGLSNTFSQVAPEKSHNCFFLSMNHLVYLSEQSCFLWLSYDKQKKRCLLERKCFFSAKSIVKAADTVI